MKQTLVYDQFGIIQNLQGFPFYTNKRLEKHFFCKNSILKQLYHCKTFFPILGSFETLNQLGDCYPNPSSVLSEPVSSGAAFVRSTKVFKMTLLIVKFLPGVTKPPEKMGNSFQSFCLLLSVLLPCNISK